MDRISYIGLENLQTELKLLLNPKGSGIGMERLGNGSVLLQITKCQERLLELRKTFEQAMKIFAAANDKTLEEQKLESLAQTNIGIIDGMVATFQELEARLVAMNCGIHTPDAKHRETAETERLERIRERESRMVIVTEPGPERPRIISPFKPL